MLNKILYGPPLMLWRRVPAFERYRLDPLEPESPLRFEIVELTSNFALKGDPWGVS